MKKRFKFKTVEFKMPELAKEVNYADERWRELGLILQKQLMDHEDKEIMKLNKKK